MRVNAATGPTFVGMTALSATDSVVATLLERESARQRDVLTLIPSENYTSMAVREALSSDLTNKYSEGYPGKRYYEGQQVIDEVEIIAISRATELFDCEHANTQALSGSPANLAVLLACVESGGTIMGMDLRAGGHLTHGWKVSITGKYFRSVQYGVEPTSGRIDFDAVRELAVRERPRLIFCGGTAIPRLIDFTAFAEISREVEAVLVAYIAHIAGLIVGGVHPTPVGVADIITRTTHKTLRGPRGALILSDAERGRDIDRAVFTGLQGGPHNNVTAAIAVALHEAAQPSFRAYAQQVVANARVLAEALIERGYNLVSGGTDNHLLLMDLTALGIGGKSVAQGLDRAGLSTNYNTIPFDERKPFDPSGLRLGTPALTTRGMKEAEMMVLAEYLDRGIRAVISGNEHEILHDYPGYKSTNPKHAQDHSQGMHVVKIRLRTQPHEARGIDQRLYALGQLRNAVVREARRRAEDER